MEVDATEDATEPFVVIFLIDLKGFRDMIDVPSYFSKKKCIKGFCY